MMKKLFLVAFFLMAGLFFALASGSTSAEAAGYINANDPFGPFPYGDINRVDISITLKDSVTNNPISGDVHLWSTYPTWSCGSSVQATVDVRRFANPNMDTPVSCVHGIWVEAYNSPGHLNFDPYCLQCSGTSCYITGHNGQTLFFTIYMDPVPVTPPPSTPGNPRTDNVPTGCLAPGSKFGSGINLVWNASSDAVDYEVQFTRGNPDNGDYATKVVTGTSASGSGGWTSGGNPLVTWLSGASLSLDPGVTYYWRVRARNSTASSNWTGSVQVGPVAICPGSSPSPGATPSPPPGGNADLVIRNSSDGTSPVVNVTLPATISGNTITVPVNQSFNISFKTRNIGTASSGVNSRTVAENFGAATGGYSQFTVGPLPPNTSSAVHSISTSYTSTGNKPILLRVDADGVVGESSESNDANVTVNVTPAIVTLPEVPTPNAPTGLPACINAGSTYGPGIGLSWSITPNFTSYKVRLTSGSRTSGDYATKTVTVNSTTGTGGWSAGGNPLVTWVSGTNLALAPGVTYFYAVSAQVGVLDSGFDLANKSVQIGPVGNCGPEAPSDLSVSTSCNGTNAEVSFTFRDNSDNETTIWLDVNGSAWTGAGSPSPWGVKTFNRTAGEKDYTGSVTWVWRVSDAVSGGPPTVPVNNTTYWWRVIAGNGTGNSAHVYPANTTTAPGVSFTTPTCAPADPYSLSAIPTCRNGNAELMFRFIDDSADEDQFVVEINDNPWNVSGVGPAPFGSKTLTRLPVQKTSRGSQVLYLWRQALPVDSGDTNSVTGGEQKVPEQNKTYWWRVRAQTDTGIASNNVYPGPSSEATLVPPGISVTTLLCVSDLEVEFDDTSWKNGSGNDPSPGFELEPKELVKVDVVVTNQTGNRSPVTDLYIYHKDNGDLPNCMSDPASSAPKDGLDISRSYTIPQINGADANPDNRKVKISVEVAVDNTLGSHTIYAYAVPKCDFDASPWGNNFDSQTYIIATGGFIETQAGDVGAGDDIAMPIKSSTLPGDKYWQSDYAIAAGSINSNVDSKNNWIFKQYNAKQVPTGGLYEYFETKLKSKAEEDTDEEGSCGFEGSSIKYCNGNLTFNVSDTAPNGDHVYFVERDLRIKKNFELDPDSSAIFFVRGDVTVDLSVNRIDGVYVVKGVFNDSDIGDAGVADFEDALTLNGALYVEGPGLNLKRYFIAPINKIRPADRFIWDPKYLMRLSSVIGVKSITWKEVAP